VAKVFSFGLHKSPESFSPLVDRFVDIACSKSAHSAHTSADVVMETAGGSQQH